jgi:hypothetical protein
LPVWESSRQISNTLRNRDEIKRRSPMLVRYALDDMLYNWPLDSANFAGRCVATVGLTQRLWRMVELTGVRTADLASLR